MSPIRARKFRNSRRSGVAAGLEQLELRRVLAAVVVDTNLDVVDGQTNSISALIGSPGADGKISLREALLAANNTAGVDDVNFNPNFFTSTGGTPDRPIVLTGGKLPVKSDLRLNGLGPAMTKVDGNGLSSVFELSFGEFSSSDVVLDGIWVTGGSQGGIVAYGGRKISITNSKVTGNSVAGISASGFTIHQCPLLEIDGVEIRDNQGSGIAACRLDLANSTVAANGGPTASGGIQVTSNGSVQPGFASIRGSQIVHNNGRGIQANVPGVSGIRSSIEVADSIIQGNHSTGFGGGLVGNTVKLVRTIVSDNYTTGDNAPGGGIYALSLDVRESVIARNKTLGANSPGGGVYAVRDQFYPLTNVSIVDSQVVDNETAGDSSPGGGAKVDALQFLTVGSRFSGNRTAGLNSDGGGLFVWGETMLQIVDSEIVDNHTSGNSSLGGGAMLSGTINGSITNSLVADNSTNGSLASGGGLALLWYGQIFSVARSIIRNNTTNGSQAFGAGFYGDSVAISQSSVVRNSTAGDNSPGGGIYGKGLLGPSGNLLQVSQSLIADNFTKGLSSPGAGVFSQSIAMENSTVTGNYTQQGGSAGGAIATASDEITSTISNSTVANNAVYGTSSTAGGISAKRLKVVSSIVANNQAAGGNPDLSVSELELVTSLLGVNAGAPVAEAQVGIPDSHGNYVGTATCPIEPWLNPLADNGGGSLTMSPLPTSPVINAGSNPLGWNEDQRGTGFVRVVGGTADMGALELQELPPMTAAPVATPDAGTVAEDGSITIDVLSNDSDADNPPQSPRAGLRVVSVEAPSHGSVTIECGLIRYTPYQNYYGSDKFKYTVADPKGLTGTAEVAITITPIGDDSAPEADVASLAEGESILVDVLANDKDADNLVDPFNAGLTLLSVSPAMSGQVAIEAGQLRYTPLPDYYGIETVTYTVIDPTGRTASSTVTFTVVNVEDPPLAVADNVTVNEDTSILFDVLANDTDPDNLVAPLNLGLEVAAVTQGTHGTVSIESGKVRYTPAFDYYGPDAFTYSVSDVTGRTNSATVTIVVVNVDDAPAPVADVAQLDEGSSILIDVLANDIDADNLASPLNLGLKIVDVTQGAHGITSIESGKIRYTPTADYYGSDSVTYTVIDSTGRTRESMVTITVVNVDDQPAAVADNTQLDEDSSILIDVLANDVDSDNLGPPFNLGLSVVEVTQGAHGAAVIEAGKVRYAPVANYYGADTITYTVSDLTGLTASTTVTIAVLNVGDAPLAAADSAQLDEGGSILVDVLSNDTDSDNLAPPLNLGLEVSGVTQGAHGTVSIESGKVRYTPAPDFYGIDGFTYTVIDPTGRSGSANVAITVANVDDQPIAVADSAQLTEDSPILIDVLANDTDADNLAPPLNLGLTIAAVTQGTHGTVSIESGKVRYAPQANFYGVDSFSYSAQDGTGLISTNVVSVAVVNANDAPSAVEDAVSLVEDSSILVDVLLNDLDVDNLSEPLNAGLTVTGVGLAGHGTVTIEAGRVRYQPQFNFSGKDFFQYTISDPAGATSVAAVKVSVEPVNDTPTAVDDSAEVTQDGTILVDVLANDFDVDNVDLPANSGLEVRVAADPANGVAVVEGVKIRYTPNPGYFGDDSFSYKIADAGGLESTATVDIVALRSFRLIVDTDRDENDGNFAKGDLSLREALEVANGNPGIDFIEFDPTFFLAGPTGPLRPLRLTLGQLSITDELMISGLGSDRTQIDAQQAGRIFDIGTVDQGFEVKLAGLWLTGGRTFADGAGGSGGAIRMNSQGVLRIEESRITGNRTEGSSARGGAVYANSLVVVRSSIEGNSTGGSLAEGGGLWAASVTLTDSTLSANSTLGGLAKGGGLWAGSLSGNNSTVTGNYTSGSLSDGGGIWAGTVTLSSSTISGNSAQGPASRGGGIWSNQVTLANTVVAQNDASSADDIRSSSVQASHSLVGSNDGTALVAAPVGNPDGNGNLIGTSAAAINPRLRPLSYSGGPTWVMSPYATSPLVNAGSNSNNNVYDQRGDGFARVVGGGTDIGSVELQNGAGLTSDVDFDGDVDTADLLLLLEGWTGALPEFAGTSGQANGDGDNDGDVDSGDVIVMLEQWTGAAAGRLHDSSIDALFASYDT